MASPPGKLEYLRNFGEAWGFIPSASAVVFLDNHDTQRGEAQLTYKSGKLYELATIFMLAHPYGYPKATSSMCCAVQLTALSVAILAQGHLFHRPGVTLLVCLVCLATPTRASHSPSPSRESARETLGACAGTLVAFAACALHDSDRVGPR